MTINELNPREIWQNFYLLTQVPRPSGHLEKIQEFKLEEGREMQIILATHSPMLVGGRWDETLDLYTLRSNG